MTEKSFYPQVQLWMRKNLNQSCPLELKLTKTNKFYLKAMEPHQLPWLSAAKHKSVSYKIPDVGFDRKPADLFLYTNSPAWVGIIFYIPRKKKNLYVIDIDDFINFFTEGIVSIDEEQCRTISSYTDSL